jgi:alpha-L-fucosidase 2
MIDLHSNLRNKMKSKISLLFLLLLPVSLPATEQGFVEMNDVVWHSLGTNENNSMPIGNGDIGVNVWTEQDGDIVLLLAKTDAWSVNGQLLKLGRVRVKLTPNPFVTAKAFSQTLKLESGEIEIHGGGSQVRVWADANNPVVHVEIHADHPVQLEATSEMWRTKSYHLGQRAVQQDGFFEFGNDPEGLTFDPDTVLPGRGNQVSWCHFNSRSIYPLVFTKEHLEFLLPKYPDPLLHRCSGVTMAARGLVRSDDHTLKSDAAGNSFGLNLYALSEQADSPEAWQAALSRKIDSINAVKIKTAWKAHEQWWAQFWNRSWLHVSGTPDAEKVSQGYVMQRYMMACAGRGAQPVKFNGSLFTVGHDLSENTSSTEKSCDPDYRAWGACFWNQNTRLLYWPLAASGDFDLLMPWFNMYVHDIPLVTDRTRAYFHHDGGAFIETIYFWGLPNVNDFGWNNPGPELQSPWMRYHIQGGLEVLAQMLDYYDYTGDASFARSSLIPLAKTVITYYDQHWHRGADGRILLSPAQSIETYQITAVNPTPDIAGLMSTLPRLLSLPHELAGEEERTLWFRVLKDLPPVPIGRTARGKLPPRGRGDPDGTPTILPAQKYDQTRNAENPELYTVFPYHLYGVGKPDLGLARTAYNARLFHMSHCWGQDALDAALLGLTGAARRGVVEELTCYGNQQFPWFWRKNSDWIPDMDDGGAGMAALQLMLMQCDGRRMLLLPAWPRDWTVDFKLHAPYQTTVEGHVENGKISNLKVVPPDRARDVVVIESTN